MEPSAGGRQAAATVNGDNRKTPCQHTPRCPGPDAADFESARVVVSYPQQGWSLLCNGAVVFEDTGALLPDGRCVEPHRPSVARISVVEPGRPAARVLRAAVSGAR